MKKIWNTKLIMNKYFRLFICGIVSAVITMMIYFYSLSFILKSNYIINCIFIIVICLFIFIIIYKILNESYIKFMYTYVDIYNLIVIGCCKLTLLVAYYSVSITSPKRIRYRNYKEIFADFNIDSLKKDGFCSKLCYLIVNASLITLIIVLWHFISNPYFDKPMYAVLLIFSLFIPMILSVFASKPDIKKIKNKDNNIEEFEKTILKRTLSNFGKKTEDKILLVLILVIPIINIILYLLLDTNFITLKLICLLFFDITIIPIIYSILYYFIKIICIKHRMKKNKNFQE